MSTTLVFPVTGMVCDHCVASLTKALSAVPGVEKAVVTLKPEEARVTFNPEETTSQTLAATVTETGFTPGTPHP